ncbi:winged helix DNA-binding protein [Limibacillus halophilus]|uniref:Putative MarR family transcription regulator n=1 Tax=Limibacillus halophilus TaxID=1579333 RepID=A0A839SWC0_9PROT|nr:winged helix DNA-binding protein [Limibacillus halophilus]MBB3065255.1 putative MarR family transcription regulator [Limibacillus halophilus]
MSKESAQGEHPPGLQRGRKGQRIVSSSHLVSETAAELSELEFGLITVSNAFSRWIVRCMAAAGCPDLSALDVMVLHSVNHRGRPKKQNDICFVLNVEDTHTVTYSLKKLSRADLVAGERVGKETLWQATEAGTAACQRYREVRETCLLEAISAFAGIRRDELNAEFGEVAELLRALSGLYDQAARSASSL